MIIQLEEYIMMPDRAQNKQLVENIAVDIQISWECSQNKNKKQQARSLQSQEILGEERSERVLQIMTVSWG